MFFFVKSTTVVLDVNIVCYLDPPKSNVLPLIWRSNVLIVLLE
jgi:hypothetical protein